MLLGIKSKRKIFLRHLLFGLISVVLIFIFWQIHSTWSPDMRLWRAFGAAAFTLLLFTVLIGPAARIFKPLHKIITFRRESGIWFAGVSLIHGYLVLDGWVRWSFWELLGYQYVPQLETYLRAEPGFGLANLMGIVAITFAVILALTSFDKAVSFLGIASWKWLHTFAYVIFYLIALHVIYFAFIHYSLSPQKVLMGNAVNYPPNPLRFYYLGAIITVFALQAAAFIKTVYSQRHPS
jgi:sulfoxide reductase heme-binding subunit YedZ